MRLEINGKKIFCDIFGEATPVLAVHGLGGTSNFWRPVVTALSGNYKLVIPDLPSAGRSEYDSDVSIETLVEDMVAIMDKLGIDKAHVLGHSMGTIVCQHLAVKHPQRIASLVLLGPLTEPPEPARDNIEKRAQLALEEEGMLTIADSIADVALSAATKSNQPNVQGFVREMVLNQSPAGYSASCRALGKAQKTDLSKLKCPVILITGDEDGVAPPKNVADMEREIEACDMVVLNQCGHWTLTEKPDEVIREVEKFYSRF